MFPNVQIQVKTLLNPSSNCTERLVKHHKRNVKLRFTCGFNEQKLKEEKRKRESEEEEQRRDSREEEKRTFRKAAPRPAGEAEAGRREEETK